MSVSAGAAFTVQEAYHSKWPSWPVAAEDNSGEISIQANPNKTSKIAWVSLDSFVRIVTYQWVTRKKIKKSASVLPRAHGCAQRSAIDPTAANFYHRLPFSRRLFSNFELSTIAQAAGRP
jgi:hypothetical protein